MCTLRYVANSLRRLYPDKLQAVEGVALIHDDRIFWISVSLPFQRPPAGTSPSCSRALIVMLFRQDGIIYMIDIDSPSVSTSELHGLFNNLCEMFLPIRACNISDSRSKIQHATLRNRTLHQTGYISLCVSQGFQSSRYIQLCEKEFCYGIMKGKSD